MSWSWQVRARPQAMFLTGLRPHTAVHCQPAAGFSEGRQRWRSRAGGEGSGRTRVDGLAKGTAKLPVDFGSAAPLTAALRRSRAARHGQPRTINVG